MSLFEESKFIRCVRNVAKAKPLILYGAGIDAVWAIEDYKRHFGGEFYGCVCDGDVHKQKLTIAGVEITSLERAMEKYSDAYFWVTAKDYKFEILGYLINEKVIPAERILNYEPVEKKKSCLYAEKMFFAFERNSGKDELDRIIRICDIYRKGPALQFESYDEFGSVFENFRDEALEKIMSGISSNGCETCSNVKESYYATSRKIRTYNLATDGRCNFKCCYCVVSILEGKTVEAVFDFAKVFDIFEQKGMLADDLHVDITSGEICVNPQRKQMLDVASKYAETISIATNASVYDEQIQQILGSRRAVLIVSIDAGTSKTFAKVKGRNMYARVKDNLLRYRQAGLGAIELKYIFLPEINDNPGDVDGFIELCALINPGVVTISFDFRHQGPISDKTVDMIRRMKQGLERGGFFYKYEARVASIIRLSD